ncbi:MAG: hypothetical protein DRN35_06535 [Thermoplasmata archaeon]|nr:MAG: hypothetical protein DRN28_05310 [Thermoplasmata archaeon]RLF68710.1 MAG: hypothetical protein DRN35_06535 [Thermoplasmata archaeon]RLF68758.1 MAG: hypothetical protein DRN40_07245 [Thermoplasmata archaeon]RLF74360.1 MAG: hypothetical protein DRN55_00205 [Thermoplasmata archaeon]HDD60057.1 DUF504 domain-containing protein [Euryarchaeota archaeon]
MREAPPPVRDVLLKLFWTDKEAFSRCRIVYRSRGSPGDVSSLLGERVVHLGRSFIEAGGLTLPYHRVLKVVLNGKVLWERVRK